MSTADLSAALQRQARVARGAFKKRDERGMRNRAVQSAASMKAVEAHARAPSKRKVAARLHIGRVGREHEIKLDGDVGFQRMSRGHRAAQIVFFLGRENEMDRRSLTNGRDQPRDLHDHRAAGAIVDRGSGDLVSGKRECFRRIDHGRTDLDARGQGGFGA